MVGKLAARLDPSLPSILAAHVLVGDAQVGRGSERAMSIGQEPALLLGNIANPAFDYVALGHIHKHQVLSEKPPVVYAGSLERVDFGEENDDKGFYVVDIEPAIAEGRIPFPYRRHPPFPDHRRRRRPGRPRRHRRRYSVHRRAVGKPQGRHRAPAHRDTGGAWQASSAATRSARP